MGQQSLIYSFVARGTTILYEYEEFTGNFTSIAAQCLQKLPDTNDKFTYNFDGHTFNYLVADGFTYCVVAVESVGRQVPMAFLERVKEDFTKTYGGGKAATAVANSLNKDIGWIEDHPNSSVAQAMNSEEKPNMDKSLEIKKDNEEEVCGSVKSGDLIQEGTGRVCLTLGDDVIDGLGSSEKTMNDDKNGIKNDDEKGGDRLEESDDEQEEEEGGSDDDEESVKGVKKVKGEVEMKESEIRDSDVEDEDEDGDVVDSPVLSKNEVQDLPIPSMIVTIESHHKTLPVGVVYSIMGADVIVVGVENHNSLSKGSILWITESRLPLGVVDEIFRPVENPYYIVRYNSETDIPTGIRPGSPISFVPEFTDYVLNKNNLYKKGYDASGENDKELSAEYAFSDVEKEAEYKKMIKKAKRRSSEQKNRYMKKSKKSRNRGGQRNNDHQRFASRPPGFSLGQPSLASGPPSFLSGQPFHGFSQGPLAPNFSRPPPRVWPNGFQSIPPQNMGFFPNGPFMQPNITQPPFQNLGLPNMAPFHPQSNAMGQMFHPKLGPNQAFGPWPMDMGQNNFNQPQVGPPMRFPGLFPGPSTNNGVHQGVGMPTRLQMTNNGVPFAVGNGETFQNRVGRKGFQRGGGRFRGGRNRPEL